MKYVSLFIVVCLAACTDQSTSVSAQVKPIEPAISKSLPDQVKHSIAGISGHAVKVFDGDSFIFKASDGERHEVRILGIDAPERGQDHAEASKLALQALLAGEVYVDSDRTDRYDRLLAHVYDAQTGQSVGRHMIATGNAWVYRAYRDDQQAMSGEEAARQAQLGLWAERYAKDPIPPWTWRAQKKDRHGR